VEDERRRTPRLPFIATAEVIEKGAQTGIAARVTELSLYGCYVEMSNPLTKGDAGPAQSLFGGEIFRDPRHRGLFPAGSGHGRRLPKCESTLFDRFETVAHRGRSGEIWEEGLTYFSRDHEN